MSISRLWAFLAVALPVLGAVVANLPMPDVAYHLRAGSDILATGSIPATDSWTFTANGLPWLDQQWGAQVVLEAVFRTAGWTGLVVLRAALVGVAVGALFLACRIQGLDRRRASWLTLGAFVVALSALALRPQLFAIALFACLLLVVTARRARPGALILAPLIAAVWVNVHGTFVLVPVVLGLALLADVADRSPVARRTFAVLVVSLVVTLLNPFGLSVWSYALNLSANPEVMRRITEWQPTSLRDFAGITFFASALLLGAFLARRGRPVPWTTLVWFGAFFVLGVYASRGIAWWAFAAAVMVPTLVDRRLEGEGASRRVESPGVRRLNVALAAAVALAAVLALPAWRPTDPNLGAPRDLLVWAPSELTRELRGLARSDDRILNPQPWGSWLEYAVPQATVAIDSRIELFPPEVWTDYLAASLGQDGWQDILDRWGVSLVLTDAAEGPRMPELLAAGGWREAFAGKEGSIFVRPDRP